MLRIFSVLPLLVLPWLAFATPTASLPAAPVCVDSAQTQVDVAGGYDAVRVVTADGEPGAALVVTVLGETSWASMTAPAGGASTLILATQPAERVTVAIEPALDAPTSACALRVELIRGGEVIASVAVARPEAPAPTR